MFILNHNSTSTSSQQICNNINNNDSNNNNKMESKNFSANILVVEDDPLNRIIASKFLKKLGHKITMAENGLQAVKFVESNTYDLILMDVHMDVMDGKEATNKIRAYQTANQIKKTPIIGLTTVPKQECLDAGMDDHLFKPCKFQQLDSKIKTYLNFENIITIPSTTSITTVPLPTTTTSSSSFTTIIECKSEQIEVVQQPRPQEVSANQRDKYISSPDLSAYFKFDTPCNNSNIKNNNNNNSNYNIKLCNNNTQCNNSNNNNIKSCNNNNNIEENEIDFIINFNECCNIIECPNSNEEQNSLQCKFNISRRKIVSRSTSQPSFHSNKEYKCI